MPQMDNAKYDRVSMLATRFLDAMRHEARLVIRESPHFANSEDEVHLALTSATMMLTTEAFVAWLMSLDEPPTAARAVAEAAEAGGELERQIAAKLSQAQP